MVVCVTLGLCRKSDSSIWTILPGPPSRSGASTLVSLQLQISLKAWIAVTRDVKASSAAGYCRHHQLSITSHCRNSNLDCAKKLPSLMLRDLRHDVSGHCHLILCTSTFKLCSSLDLSCTDVAAYLYLSCMSLRFCRFMTVPHAEQLRCCEKSPRAWNHAIWSSIVPASTLDRSSIFMLAHTALVGPTEYTVVLPRLSLPRLAESLSSAGRTRAGGETSVASQPHLLCCKCEAAPPP